MATLEVRSLHSTPPGEDVAITDVSFAVREGRICALLGASGCGNTSLLRLIAGLDRAASGDVLLDGQSIAHQPPHRRGVGLMFQDLALFDHMTARENIAFGLRMVGWPRAEREQRVSDLLEVVGLAALGPRRVEELLPDEQQRVALARALAPQPSVLLLDEPLGAIDEMSKTSLRLELRSVLNALESTAVIATHDLRDAIAIADDIVILDRGRMLQAGPIGVVLGEPATVEEAGVGAMTVPGLPPEADAARVMAHPSALLAVPTDSGLGSGVAGLVVRTRAQGPTWLVDLAVGGRMIEARWEWDLVPPRNGTRLAVAARPGTLRVFSTSLDELPAPVMPATPGIDATPPTPGESITDTETREAPEVSDVPASATPPTLTPNRSRTASPPTGTVARNEQRHRDMPLS
ncbi:MAG: ABC transporter ATP-binding protein [Chloroflexota bacterium]